MPHPERVSVVIPCFNREQYIGAAIESCLRQTYRAAEIIVVDDGSSDRSVERIRSYAPAVTCIESSNHGPGHARNLGLRAATGDFVHFLDSDDLLAPDALANELAMFDAFPDTDVVYGRVFAPFDHTFAAGFVVPGKLGDRVEAGIMLPVTAFGEEIGLPIPTSVPLLYRRRVLIESGGYDESVRALDNIEINFRLFVSGYRFRQFDQVVIVYRDDRTISRVTDRESWESEDAAHAYETMVRFAEASGSLRGVLRMGVVAMLYHGGHYAVSVGCRKVGGRYFALAAEIMPGYVPGSALFKGLTRFMGPVRASRIVNRSGRLPRNPARAPRAAH
jgi:glycosyltransferase involved in cell wall biosynthesis